MGYTVDEVITMASIIQGEAASKEQMAGIAGVLYNRLDSPSKFSILECDSTQNYLKNTVKPTLTSSTEDTQKYIAFRKNYDTYESECKGLPVGAINNPGNDAISAALNPEDSSYYFFRHDSKGKIYYANTVAEHDANGRKIAKTDK